MKSAYCYFLAFLLALSAHPADAQFSANYNFKFKTYTSKDGLVHNYTKECITDHKGFLWVITEHGLSRFDGLDFKNFEHHYADSTGLPENDLLDIDVDSKDRIWVSYKGGICYYDQSARKFHNLWQNGKPLACEIFVYDSTRNCIWSADYNNYYKIDCASEKIMTFPIKQPTNLKLGIEQLYVDSKDRLWILMDRLGYYTINLKTDEQYYFDQDIWPMHVYEDESHIFWMSTWGSGFRKINFNGNKQEHTLYIDPFISKNDPYGEITYGITKNEALTGNDILWISNSTNGILLFDKKQEKFIKDFHYDAAIKNGIATDFYNLAYTDPCGILWLCSWHGLTKVNKKEQQFNSRELSFLQTHYYNRLSGIENDPYDKNVIWIGAEGSGIIKYDRVKDMVLQKYYYTYADPGMVLDNANYDWRWTQSMFTDSRKNIWATTYGGLLKIAHGTVTKKPLQDGGSSIFPKTITEFPQGTLWISSERGLCRMDLNTEKIKIFRIAADSSKRHPKENSFRDITQEDSDHIITVGPGGAYRFTVSSGSFTRLNWFINGLDSGGQQNCYAVQKINNSLYIGTYNGLIKYDLLNGGATLIGAKENIDKVYDNRLKKDARDNLWIFTAHGLFEYNTQHGTMSGYSTGDGIYDFNEDKIGFFEYEGLFYIGYRMAMTSFDPLSVNENRVESNPVITDISVNNQLLNENIDSFATHSLELPYRENNIKFDFTAADFTNSGRITFAYMLSGYDNDWIYGGTARTATYANLKGGKYVFRVKACNSSGVWNEKDTEVNIKIETPFWQAWWFYLLIAVLIFLIAYLLYRRRLNRLVELYKIRDAISKNLHDEIGATLSSINIYSDVARKKNTGDTDTGLLMERIHKASGRVMESMNDIVWYVNPKNDSWDNIVLRMREYAIPLLEAKDINPDFRLDESVLRYKLNMQQRQHVYFIFKEAINNVVKYADATEVKVILDKKEKNILLVIRDNGKGFDLHNIRKGNGLLNMEQRAEEMKGVLQITTEPGGGTTISLRVPIT